MAPFYPLYVTRSDGKLECAKNASLKGGKEPNEPLPAQMKTDPDSKGICDFYRFCDGTHPKDIDWRRKLAGMLVKEIGDADMQDKNYILVSLPENFRLYEHIRYKAADRDPNIPGGFKKGHSGAGSDRQDAYLYGHPNGRKKRYRSPADFFPHVLWLATDESGDPNNCSCRFCTPEELESEAQPDTKPKLPVVSKLPPKDTPDLPKTAAKPQPPPPAQSLLPRARNSEQKMDMEYNKFLYRSGEVVWFQRGQAWGLGTIAQRFYKALPTPKYSYKVQPLSHPLATQTAATCPQEQLRNWLAWSPPPCMYAGLNPSEKNGWKPITYDSVDWRQHITTKSTVSEADVDGSILAAKSVESTYCVFELLDSKTSTSSSSQISEKYYNGIYIGAEKVWLGDAVRLREEGLTDMLILHTIIERQSPSDPSRSTILLKGDVYTPTSAPHGSSLIPRSQDQIPARVRADMAARNAIVAKSPDPAERGKTHFVQLSSKDASFTLTDIKGRWYESSLFMPIVSPGEYENGKAIGVLADASLHMNGHGDCNRPLPIDTAKGKDFRAAWIRVKKREEAFGRAVPMSYKVMPTVEDFTPPSADVQKEHISQMAKNAMQAVQQQNQRPKADGQNGQATTQKPSQSLASQQSQLANREQQNQSMQQQNQSVQQQTQPEQQQQQNPAQQTPLQQFMTNTQQSQYLQHQQHDQHNPDFTTSLPQTFNSSDQQLFNDNVYDAYAQQQSDSWQQQQQPTYNASNPYQSHPYSFQHSGQQDGADEEGMMVDPVFDELMDFEPGAAPLEDGAEGSGLGY